MTFSRSLKLGLLALGLAMGLFLTAAMLGHSPRDSAGPPFDPVGRGEVVSAAEVANPGDLTAAIASLQARLEKLPADATSWAALGSAYIQQSRITGDPSYYAKASGVLRRSLEEQPNANFAALTGQAALAAARHDFGAALALAERSQRINRFSATNLGILVDALVELGRYDEAIQAAQRMVNLKPSVPSFTRVSYLYELRGDLRGARYAMNSALEIAFSTDDKAFALYQLGELAFNAGDLDEAVDYFEQGLSLEPAFTPLLYGKAKVEAAQGDTAAALADYQTVVQRLPLPGYLIDFAAYLTSLDMDAEAADLRLLLRTEQRILTAAGVNVDLELAVYDADNGHEKRALRVARRTFAERKGIFAEDALRLGTARERQGPASAGPHPLRQPTRHAQCAARLSPGRDRARSRPGHRGGTLACPGTGDQPLLLTGVRTRGPHRPGVVTGVLMRSKTRLQQFALLATLVVALLVLPVSAASAHPLGNFTINHYNGLLLAPDHIDNSAVIDFAELPTVQLRDDLDGDSDGTVSADEQVRLRVHRMPHAGRPTQADRQRRCARLGREQRQLRLRQWCGRPAGEPARM
ncbi:MAG: tetratricopeptide repeat protein [Nocardioidaceae bacterium]